MIKLNNHSLQCIKNFQTLKAEHRGFECYSLVQLHRSSTASKLRHNTKFPKQSFWLLDLASCCLLFTSVTFETHACESSSHLEGWRQAAQGRERTILEVPDSNKQPASAEMLSVQPAVASQPSREHCCAPVQSHGTVAS